MATDLQLSMAARSSISRAYCYYERKRPVVVRCAVMPRKWCRSPRSDMANSACRAAMMERSRWAELAVSSISSMYSSKYVMPALL